MQRSQTIILFALVVFLTSASNVAAETERGRITSSDRLYSFIADSSQSTRITLMWDKASTDVDVGIFDQLGNVIAISIGSTDGLEAIEVGVVSGVIYTVVLSKFRGPNAKFQLNVSTAGSEIVTRSPQLTPLGDLDSLAATDSYFAHIRESMELATALK